MQRIANVRYRTVGLTSDPYADTFFDLRTPKGKVSIRDCGLCGSTVEVRLTDRRIIKVTDDCTATKKLKAEILCRIVTGGLDTDAVRWYCHEQKSQAYADPMGHPSRYI